MKTTKLILALFGAAGLAVAANATLVTLDTSSLTQGGTYYVDFQLNDGSGNATNYARASNFTFGGGSAGADIGGSGTVAGNLSSTLQFSDANTAFNEFYQSFTAGTSLSFDLFFINKLDAPVPDIFGFAILDENLFNLATFSPIADQFMFVEMSGSALDFQTFAGIDGVPAPTVPEAGRTLLFASGFLLALAGFRRRLGVARITA